MKAHFHILFDCSIAVYILSHLLSYLNKAFMPVYAHFVINTIFII